MTAVFVIFRSLWGQTLLKGGPKDNEWTASTCRWERSVYNLRRNFRGCYTSCC